MSIWSHMTNFKGYLLPKKEKTFRKEWPKFKENIALSFCGVYLKPQEFCRQDEISFSSGNMESRILLLYSKIPQEPDLWKGTLF